MCSGLSDLQWLQLKGLEVLGDFERGFGFALDLVHSHAFGDLDQGKTVGEVNVEYSLDRRRHSMLDSAA